MEMSAMFSLKMSLCMIFAKNILNIILSQSFCDTNIMQHININIILK